MKDKYRMFTREEYLAYKSSLCKTDYTCQHCDGTGGDVRHIDFHDIYHMERCKYCLGTGIHTPLSQDEYL